MRFLMIIYTILFFCSACLGNEQEAIKKIGKNMFERVVIIIVESMVTSPNTNFKKGEERKSNKPELMKFIGAGTVINKDEGYILTASHLINGVRKIFVPYFNKKIKAKIIHNNTKLDIAIIQIDKKFTKKYFKNSEFEQHKNIYVGMKTCGIGHPNRLPYTLKCGVISQYRFANDVNFVGYLYQLDFIIQQGDSGGPIYNMNNKIVGMYVMGSTCSKNQINSFIIPSKTIVNEIKQYLPVKK